MLGQICKTIAVPSYRDALQNNLLSDQVRFEGTCGHILVYRWHVYVLEVVSAIFEQG